ncbi:MAG: deoxyribose-phosphate aldolase [Christensenellales bacterium]|jgi:deoxyribose-phosphate aldolase
MKGDMIEGPQVVGGEEKFDMEPIARYIDQTLLNPAATGAEVEAFVKDALPYRFQSCCVNSAHIERVAALLKNSSTLPCSVVAFPFGAAVGEAKIAEAVFAAEKGALEIDYVVDIGRAVGGDFNFLSREAHGIVAAVGRFGVTVKAILELCYLDEQTKERAARAVLEGGVDFLKTSTGYGGGGATVADVSLLRRVAGKRAKVKASGGIRDYETAMAMIRAGADRIGASAGGAIVAGET